MIAAGAGEATSVDDNENQCLQQTSEILSVISMHEICMKSGGRIPVNWHYLA